MTKEKVFATLDEIRDTQIKDLNLAYKEERNTEMYNYLYTLLQMTYAQIKMKLIDIWEKDNNA